MLALIGFGEAGSSFASEGAWHGYASGFDRDLRRAAVMRDMGLRAAADPADALAGANAILSLVTADQSLEAARQAAANIPKGAFFFDMNSVAPGTKRETADLIESAGASYVDVAVMAPVLPARLAVPLLLSGPHAREGAALLATCGFRNIRIVAGGVGQASTIKMLRSVFYKGVEALTAECLLACHRAGVLEEVLGSFDADWAKMADYRLDRMLAHGARRAAEMAESAKTLDGLGVVPLLTRGTIEWQAALGSLSLAPIPATLAAKLERIDTP
ncbi:Phosphogluconate dehydrogenase, NAD-binding protein [Sphingobium chlorophenolicum L-1]|uniref:Phosphogluconate dehydrogenase, NAD-binding protein n=2 Tax=Sphingobium chlorophenolicum TaxID=46429 RepID=F6F1R0_SPHCR|nr:Phosphogluconate dehydrogenase, NAD-binding protein [Sphingobium chlorophenolicum L-1]